MGVGGHVHQLVGQPVGDGDVDVLLVDSPEKRFENGEVDGCSDGGVAAAFLCEVEA